MEVGKKWIRHGAFTTSAGMHARTLSTLSVKDWASEDGGMLSSVITESKLMLLVPCSVCGENGPLTSSEK